MDSQNDSSEPTVTLGDEPEAPKIDERAVLMQRARLMGIEFSNNISTEKLRERINAKLDGAKPGEDPASATAEDGAEINALTGEPANAPKKSLRQQIWDEEMRLVRVRITCMDPKKKDLHGEIFTIANEYLGTVRKFVPFGEATENGYHIPNCIYKMMEEKRFLHIRTIKDRKTGTPRIETSEAKEFAIEVLPPLTPEELQKLAIAQAASGSLEVA